MSDNELFVSSTQMSHAVQYNQWTYEKFETYICGKVLEVGCGVGNFSRLILKNKNVTELYSIDISAPAVQSCTENISDPRAAFQCIDIVDVEGSYDFIVCMNVLEHIEDHQSALKHMLSLLAPGGTLFLLVPAHQTLFTPFDTAAGHFRRYNKEMMRDLVRQIDAPAIATKAMYYFNAIGALGYYAVYGVLRKEPTRETPGEISFFDSCIVPVMKHIEGQWLPFGLSLITVFTNQHEE